MPAAAWFPALLPIGAKAEGRWIVTSFQRNQDLECRVGVKPLLHQLIAQPEGKPACRCGEAHLGIAMRSQVEKIAETR